MGAEVHASGQVCTSDSSYNVYHIRVCQNVDDNYGSGLFSAISLTMRKQQHLHAFDRNMSLCQYKWVLNSKTALIFAPFATRLATAKEHTTHDQYYNLKRHQHFIWVIMEIPDIHDKLSLGRCWHTHHRSTVSHNSAILVWEASLKKLNDLLENEFIQSC